MRCLVTGGAGFIGSNLVDALLARGDEVTVVDDLSTGRRSNLDSALAAGAELVELDIREGVALTELAQERRPQRIFHLAAQIDVRKSIEEFDFDHARGLSARPMHGCASSRRPPSSRGAASRDCGTHG